jgi:uncharacterized 2Fe-2S/4Fe-4S cluster protein (DUF4445 family)
MKLKILPENIIKKFEPSAHLKDILEDTPISITYPCGGSATCGKCRVQFTEGAPEPSYADSVFFTESELQNGFRLACTCSLFSSATMRVPQSSRIAEMAVLKRVKIRPLKLNPFVVKHTFLNKTADIQNLHSDEEIVLENFKKSVDIHNQTLQKLPDVLSDPAPKLTATVAGNSIIDVDAGDTSGQLYGCAVDLGTTTLVTGIYNLSNGQTVGIDSGLNPQIKFGEDLISRITYINDRQNRVYQLQKMVIDRINRSIHELCQQNQISPDEIYQVVVAGNAAQNHIFCGVNPYRLSIAPFTPVFKRIRTLRSEELGLQTFPSAPVWILPNLGGFVGGDVIADMLVAGFYKRRNGVHLLLDIGTNCEVILQHNNVLYAASSPAGPAMEGACISCGMRAESGAIYDIFFDDDTDTVDLKTIDDQPARGICGSGLFHVIAEALRQGWIGSDGRLRQEIQLGNHPSESSPIVLTQSDVREFQLAKAAIAAAWKTLCKDAHLDYRKIDTVYIAGAFGNFIRPDVALKLGLVPPIDLSKIHFIGNASLAGARMALLNKMYLSKSKKMSREARFVELAGRPDFQDAYVDNMNLGSEVR